MENGFVIVQYFVVKTQQDDMIENVSIVHVHYRWRLRWQWWWWGGWLGVVGIWKAVHLRTCDIVLGILEIVNNQFILKSNVARMEWLILDFWSFCLWYAQFKVVLYVQGFFKPWYSLWSKWQLSLNGSHHEVMQSLTANSYKSVMENY